MHAADGLGLQTPRRWDCDEALFANKELLVAPVDALGEKAGEPDEECEGVANRQRPEFAAHKTYRPFRDAPTTQATPAQQRISSNICGGDGGGICQDGSEHSPRQTLREDQAEMAPGARIANREIPAKLMTKRFGSVWWDNRWRRETGSARCDGCGGDAIAEFVVVAKIIDERFESADFSEAPLGGRHHGAEHEVEAATAPEPCDEHSGREIGAIAEGLKIGGEGSSVSPR